MNMHTDAQPSRLKSGLFEQSSAAGVSGMGANPSRDTTLCGAMPCFNKLYPVAQTLLTNCLMMRVVSVAQFFEFDIKNLIRDLSTKA